MLGCFPWFFFVGPTFLDIVDILIPVSFRISRTPVALQLSFKLVVPLRKFLAVLSARSVAETIGLLGLFINRNAARRNRLASRSLLDGVVVFLSGIRLIASHVVFVLVPVALDG